MAQRGRGDDHRGRDPERLLLIPGSRDGQAKKRVPWHQKPHAGCLVLAVLSLFGLGAVLLPSFESPGNITVFRAAEADARVRQLAGWREDLEAPAPEARHAVTLAIKQDREAILAALATTSDPDSPRYGQHYSLEEVAAISTPTRSAASVRAFVEKAVSGMGAARVSWSPGRDYVRVEARIEDLDKIFNAKFRRWERVLRGEVVHETYRTRELAVPKDLEPHLDGFLGALHLPSGQLQRRDAESEDAGSAARVEDRASYGGVASRVSDDERESTEDPERTATSSLAAAEASAAAGVPAGPVAPSAYSDRAPVRIGKPPRRVRVSERDWVLREAQALADEASATGGDGDGDATNQKLPKAFRVKVSGDENEDLVVSVPTETGSETSLRVRGERYLDETPAHLAVDKTLSRVQASARYMFVEKQRTEEGATKRGDAEDEAAAEGDAGARRTRRLLAEEDEDEDAEDATVASSRPASSSAKRAAASKAAERKRRGARARGELEDKANAMFQKLDEEMREMKTFMAEVVHKDVIGDVETLGDDDASEDEEDEEDAPDRSGDGEADGGGSADPTVARRTGSAASDPNGDEKTSVRREDSDSATGSSASYEDAPLPVVEAGSEAAKRAAKRVSDSSAREPSTASGPDGFWTTPPERSGEAWPKKTFSASSLPPAPATRDALNPKPGFPADAGGSPETLSEEGDGGGYYEYELNYDAEAAEAEWSEKTYAFEAAEGESEALRRERRSDDAAKKREDEAFRSALFDGESAAARSKRASQVEERLKTLVTPDKVLGYYNVPRTAAATRPGATLGVAAFAGDATRLRATIWKYAEYFNVSVGAVRAVEQEDAVHAAEAKRLANARESNAEDSDGDPDADGVLAPGAREDASAARRTDDAADWERFFPTSDMSNYPRDVWRDASASSPGGAAESDDASASTLGRVGGSSSRGGGGAPSPRRASASAEKRFAEPREGGEPKAKSPSRTEKMEAAAQSAVASAVSGAVDAAVDAADAFAEGVGLAVEKGDRGFESGPSRDRAAEKKRKSGKKAPFDENGASERRLFPDGDPRPAFRGDAEVAASATEKDARSFPSRATKTSAPGEASSRRNGADALREAAPRASGGADVSSASDAPTPPESRPVTAADLGWHDLASSRLESNLDVQAATATARGGAVDLFTASPSQHYGWEALDVVLSLAARPDPPSVLSLSFGGMERPRAGGDLSDDPELWAVDESVESVETERESSEAYGTSAVEKRAAPAESASGSRARGAPRLGASANGTAAANARAVATDGVSDVTTERASVSSTLDAGRSVEAREAGSSSPSASARGLEDALKPRPSYVKVVDAWDTLERVDTEMAKLGLRGVTVVAASGDNGPFSFGIPNPYQSWSSPDTPCSFQPSLPGSMPHVVAVGGTTGGKDPFKPERAAAVESGGKITSGGGFSDVFPQPEWQKLAVRQYLKRYAYDLPPESFFNASNRAYPDVAFASEDIAVVFAAFGAETAAASVAAPPDAKEEGAKRARLGTSLAAKATDPPRDSVGFGGVGSDAARGVSDAVSDSVGASDTAPTRLDVRPAVDDALARRARHYLTESSGTSYAAPLFAGMIALINDERLALNKTTVGFVSPALYALHRTRSGAAVFNDIKEGSSKCPNANMCGAMVGCCKHGFRAGKGWDPLTGLGSVDFSRLRDELVGLP